MMGKDGQHVKESPTPSASTTSSSSRPQDDPHQRLDTSGASSTPPDFPHHVPQVAVIPPDQHQQVAPLLSPPWSHMTSHVTSSQAAPQQSHASLFAPSRPGLVPPPPIPNIVVDPVPPRDAFGHSRTPPFVPSPSEWVHRPSTRWSLMIPGLGKKPRAHSDSSIMGLEKEQQTPPYPAPPASAVGLPMSTGEPSASVFQFEETYSTPARTRDSLTVPLPGAIEVATASVPMETDRPVASQPEQQQGGSRALDLAMSRPSSTMSPPTSLALSPETGSSSSSRGAMDKPSVPFIWHFQSHKGFEKSPKTYWLRRHSDSNLPNEPQDLSTGGTGGGTGGEALRDPGVSSIRSHSTGDTVATRGRSEGDVPLPSPPPPPLQPIPPRHGETPELSPTSPGSHREEGVVIRRLKLKKYLQKRYQLSLRRRRQSSDTDDVFSDRGPETPSPGFLQASQGFVYPPPPSSASSTAGSGSTSSTRTERSSFEATEATERTLSGTAEEVGEMRQPPVRARLSAEESPVRRPPLSLRETVPIKTEPISPCESEEDVDQPETPVFASPSFRPVRGHSESPRWHGNVFQFHAPSVYRHSSSEREPSPDTGTIVPRPESVGSPRESVGSSSRMSEGSQSERSLLAMASTVAGLPPHTFSMSQRPGSMESRTTDTPRSHPESSLRSQISPLSSSSSPSSSSAAFSQSPEASSVSSSQGPLPPFSTMLQRSPLQRPPVPAFSYPQPFASYTQGPGPVSPAPTAALGAPPWETGMPPHSPSLSPHQFPSSSSLPTTQPPPTASHGSKSEPSKIIYCPFSEKVQEQRHSRDPNTTFMCPVCGQVFPSYNYLANHMVNHLPSEVVTKGPGDSNKIHLCKVCNRAFSRSDMLTRHMRLHTGLRPYECRICGQVFSRSDHLHTHLRTHTGEKPYKCPQCPYAAPRRDMITRHMRIHMKQFSRRGRRSSSASSDLQPSQTGSDVTGAQVQDVKRRNQSLSSIESQDSTESPYRLSSTASEAPDMDSPQAKSRSWSITSAESMDLPPSRHWSATSMESTESYPSPRGDHSPRGRHYFSFHSSGDSGEGAGSLLPPGGWGSSIEEGMEHDTSPSPSTGQALSPASDSLSAEMQSSFQKCKVTSDKDSTSSSGSDKDTTMSPVTTTTTITTTSAHTTKPAHDP